MHRQELDIMTKPVPSFQKGSSGKLPRSSHDKNGTAPRQVEHRWNFYRKSVYIAKARSGLPGWLLPLLALVLIVGLVFWGVPAAINRLRDRSQNQADGETKTYQWIYNEQTRVVNKPVADVFAEPDLKAARVTQTLYNEPVTLRAADLGTGQTDPQNQPNLPGFEAVQLADGTVGYMKSRDLTDRRTSVEPDLYQYKLVIATAAKRIMSHASQGTLLAEVMMGTILYADYRGDGISRVSLPDGSTGWISDEGVIVLPVAGQIEIPADAARYFCSTALTFRQVTVIDNGQSVRGVSTTGIARLSAAINGLAVPRTLAGLSQSGRQIPVVHDETSGLIDLTILKPGDLLFLSAKQASPGEAVGSSLAEPVDLAIYVDINQVLYARPAYSSIQLLDLTQNEDLQQRISLIRRLFG